MVDSLIGLRHDSVIGGDHENNDVCHLGSTGAHHREGFVTGRVYKGQFLTIFIDLVSADTLCDSADLCINHGRAAYRVKQSGFAVVNMSKHRDDRRPQFCVWIFFHDLFCANMIASDALFFFLWAQDLNADTSRNSRRVCEVHRVVHRHHQATSHQELDRLNRIRSDLLGKFRNGQDSRNFDRFRWDLTLFDRSRCADPNAPAPPPPGPTCKSASSSGHKSPSFPFRLVPIM